MATPHEEFFRVLKEIRDNLANLDRVRLAVQGGGSTTIDVAGIINKLSDLLTELGNQSTTLSLLSVESTQLLVKTAVDAVKTAVDSNKSAVDSVKTAVDTNKSAVDLVTVAVDSNKAAVDLTTAQVLATKNAVDAVKTELALHRTGVLTDIKDNTAPGGGGETIVDQLTDPVSGDSLAVIAGASLINGTETVVGGLFSAGLSVASAVAIAGVSVFAHGAKSVANWLSDSDAKLGALDTLIAATNTALAAIDTLLTGMDSDTNAIRNEALNASGDIVKTTMIVGLTKWTLRPSAGQKVKIVMLQTTNNHASATRTATFKWTDGTTKYTFTQSVLTTTVRNVIFTNRTNFAELVLTRNRFLEIEFDGAADANGFDFEYGYENLVGTLAPSHTQS